MTKQSNDQYDQQYSEQLSALMDGELSAEALQQLLKRVEQRPQLRQQWSDHHAVRHTLFEKRNCSVVHSSIADRVAAAIESEPVVLAPATAQPKVQVARPKIPAWVPLALAASRATVTFWVMQPQIQNSTQQLAKSSVETEWVEVDGAWIERWGNPMENSTRESNARVRSYLVRHDENRSSAQERASLVSMAPSGVVAQQRGVAKRIVGWKVGWLPEGFQEVDTLQHQIPSFGGAVTHLVLSNGEAVFSVFIEKSASEGESERQMKEQERPVNLYSHSQLGHRITVLGEVPMDVVRKVARSVEAQSG